MWILSSEIDKLIALKRGSEITVEDVKNSNLSKIDDNIFNLTDAVGNKDIKQALKLLHDNMEEGANEIYLLTMIVRQFRILLQIKKASEGNKRVIAKELGLHPFVVQKAMGQVGKYTLERLKEIYKKLLETDIALKTGGGESRVLLEQMVVEIGQ